MSFSIHKAVENRGGGRHGQGWLGNEKWTVSHAIVSSDGCCKCCAKKLVTIDLDPEETKKFAKSVALLATWKETNSSFRKFQWSLVVLHNRRITGDNMDNPFNRALIEKSKNEDAIYATPIGSNDNCEWSVKIPIILITGAATSTDAPTNVITYRALQYLSTSMLFLKSPAERMDAIIEAILMALVQQFSIKPLSFVLKILVDEGDNKRSWYEDLANLPEELSNHDFELPSYRTYSCLHEARRYHKVALLDLYLKALDPELYNSRLSNHDCDNAKYKNLLSDDDKLFKLQKAEVTNQVIRKIRIQIDYGIDKLSESVFQTLDRCYIASIQRLRPREEEFAEFSNNNDNIPGIIPQVSSKVGCLIVLDRDIKEFLGLGEAVGTKVEDLIFFYLVMEVGNLN
ncbi:putative protein SPA1-RELATED 3-like isoform X1 [Capsicum annuum]|nr:putative protein SPA1-RELATED 3-like isoform X1 [Capsicum annuum]